MHFCFFNDAGLQVGGTKLKLSDRADPTYQSTVPNRFFDRITIDKITFSSSINKVEAQLSCLLVPSRFAFT